MKSSRYTSILGIAFEGDTLTVALLHRQNGGFQVQQAFRETLSLDSLKDYPERIGHDLRRLLEQRGIRERRCVVSIPLRWTFTHSLEMPSLPENDVESYLKIQAEREFPFTLDDLSLRYSRSSTPDGSDRALLIALAQDQLAALQKALQVARLRPWSITCGITSLIARNKSSNRNSILLVIGERDIEMAVVAGDSIVIMRTLNEVIEGEQDDRRLDGDLISRQIRIALGQLPQELMDKIHQIWVYGDAGLVQPLCNQLDQTLNHLGLKSAPGKPPLEIPLKDIATGEPLDSLVLEPVLMHCGGQAIEYDFLPPPSSPFSRLTGRVSSRWVIHLAGAALVLLIGAIGLFTIQYWRLARLNAEWGRMESQVSELRTTQENIRKYRPWYDDSIPSLSIARSITEAFPENGTVWIRTLEITNQSQVSCSGSARSQQAWLEMLDRLRETEGVGDLKILQVRGDNPLQFTLSFHWSRGH